MNLFNKVRGEVKIRAINFWHAQDVQNSIQKSKDLKHTPNGIDLKKHSITKKQDNWSRFYIVQNPKPFLYNNFYQEKPKK